MASLTAIRNFKARYNRIQPKIKVKKHPVWSIATTRIRSASSCLLLDRMFRSLRSRARMSKPSSPALRSKSLAAKERKTSSRKRLCYIITSRLLLLNAERNCAILLLLMLDTGFRANELCNIMLQQVDQRNQRIQVFGKGALERSVPFSPRTAQALFHL